LRRAFPDNPGALHGARAQFRRPSNRFRTGAAHHDQVASGR
jgi:hypothetical protein